MAVLLVLLAYCGWIAAAAAGLTPDTTLCPFRLLTGLKCPLCGATHALAELLQGHWDLAHAQHSAAAILALILLGSIGASAWLALRRPPDNP